MPGEMVAAAVKALAEMITEIMRGQPPDVKKQLWDWYIADMQRWRKFWGVPD